MNHLLSLRSNLIDYTVVRLQQKGAMDMMSMICLSIFENSMDRQLLTLNRYDLGEFDQKSGLATKWGTKDELLDLCNTAKRHDVGIYFDAVLNHRFGADHTEKCKAVVVHPQNRNKMVSKPHDIDAWVGYDFPGRGDMYSQQKYHWNHFSGVDYDNNTKKVAIYNIIREHSKGWAKKGDVDDELGN